MITSDEDFIDAQVEALEYFESFYEDLDENDQELDYLED